MIFNVNFYWCNLLVHDASMIIVISVYVRKDFNEIRRRRRRNQKRLTEEEGRYNFSVKI